MPKQPWAEFVHGDDLFLAIGNATKLHHILTMAAHAPLADKANFSRPDLLLYGVSASQANGLNPETSEWVSSSHDRSYIGALTSAEYSAGAWLVSVISTCQALYSQSSSFREEPKPVAHSMRAEPSLPRRRSDALILSLTPTCQTEARLQLCFTLLAGPHLYTGSVGTYRWRSEVNPA